MADKTIFQRALSSFRKDSRNSEGNQAPMNYTPTGGNQTGYQNQPVNNTIQSLEQQQQKFLDWQMSSIAKDLYSRTVYYDTDRLTAYQDYRAMDNSPEIAAALDIIRDECLVRNEKGNILEITSGSERVKEVLKDLFFNKLNIDYNLRLWIRELIKQGDFFLHLHIDGEGRKGVFDVMALPAEEIHREEGVNGIMDNTRFKWDVKNLFFEEWQIAHFRLIEDTRRLPYGRCLAFDTFIDTNNGKKWIQDIKVGDIVYSFDKQSKIKVETTVVNTVCSGEKEIYKIKTNDNEIESSVEHYFMVYESKFVYKSVFDLKVGDLLIIDNKSNLGNGSEFMLSPIISKEHTGLKKKVYDIQVENENHNFYANGIVVHNSILDPARKLWKQLQLCEDAMLVYRLCLKGDSRIKTENGYTYIKDLNVGDSVYSFDREGKLFLNKVSAHYNNGVKQLFKLKTENNEIICTKEHPLLVAKEVEIDLEVDKGDYVEIVKDKVKVTYYIEANKIIPGVHQLVHANPIIIGEKTILNSENQNLPKYIDEDFADLFGCLLNHGCVTENYFKLSPNKKQMSILEKYFDNIDKYQDGTVVVNSTLYFDLLNTLGIQNKRIPSWVFKSDANIKKSFIKGFCNLHDSNLLNYEIKLPNKYLAEDVKELWSSIGLSSGSVLELPDGFWSVVISEKELDKYEDVLSFEEYGTEEVFDITVEKAPHNFVVNNVISHNSRAPERRIFYIDVGNIDNSDVKQYIDQVKLSVKGQPIVDARTGNINRKFNPAHVEEDFFIPIRGEKSSKIETLPGACLSLDTEICLVDGRNLSLSEIISEYEHGNQLWAYSINPKSGEIVPGKITWAGVTRKNTNVVKITLSNGQVIITTPDHKFPTRFNNIQEAKDLQVNEFLWGFYQNLKPIGEQRKKYELVYDFSKQKFIYTHRLVNKYFKDNNIKDEINYVDFVTEKTKLFSNDFAFEVQVVSVELLKDKIDTGTITIDGDEEFHNFHNFALKSGVFTQNSNMGEIADIEYLEKKLFAALKVPKPYLNYAEAMAGGSMLSQADLRFSRTINSIQESALMELRRIANIHLLFTGFEDEMDNFKLTLTNPSTQQELLHLETWRTRLEIFKEFFNTEVSSPASYTWAMENILGFSKEEIKLMLKQKKVEKKLFTEIEAAAETYKKIGLFDILDKRYEDPLKVAQAQAEQGGESNGDDFSGGDDFGSGGLGSGGSDFGLGGGIGSGGGLGSGGNDFGLGGDIGTDESGLGGVEDLGGIEDISEPTEEPDALSESKQTKYIKRNLKESDKRYLEYFDELFETEQKQKQVDSNLLHNYQISNTKTDKLKESMKKFENVFKQRSDERRTRIQRILKENSELERESLNENTPVNLDDLQKSNEKLNKKTNDVLNKVQNKINKSNDNT